MLLQQTVMAEMAEGDIYICINVVSECRCFFCCWICFYLMSLISQLL